MGFIGGNGAGKTTTLKSFMNIVRPDSGRITFLGKDMHNHEFELKQKSMYFSYRKSVVNFDQINL